MRPNFYTQDTSRAVVPIFDKEWNKQLLKVEAVQTKAKSGGGKASYTKVNGAVGVDFTEKGGPEEGAEKKVLASVLPALLGAFGTTFFVGSAMKLIPDGLAFVSPQILK